MRTADVRELVREVMATLPEPYSHHVIDEVFFAIESDRGWLTRYEALCSELGRDVVNNWGGRWVALALGKVGEQQVPSKKSKLIGSYSILDTDARPGAGKPTRAEALQLMSDYYRSHKGDLPQHIREHRDLIVELLLDGVPAEDAFNVALNSSA